MRAALADGGTLLLADERGALAMAEMMRVRLDEQGLGWDEAWARTRAATVSRFGSPTSQPRRPFWLGFLEQEEPRLIEILYEINRRHLDEVERRWPGDGERRRRLSLFREGEARRLRPGPLAVIGLGTRRRGDALGRAGRRDARRPRRPARQGAARAADAVFARRWLAEGNPPLAELLAQTLGAALGERSGALRAARDAGLRRLLPRRVPQVRRANRERLAARLREAAGVETDPDALVDVRLGLLAGHERPLLNVARPGARAPAPHRRRLDPPRSADASSSPAWPRPKTRAASGSSAYCTPWPTPSTATSARARRSGSRSCPRATTRPGGSWPRAPTSSNQPGTAGSGAAGARALGLAVNGAVTLGTRDGTVCELEAAVGAENLFLFGLGPLETHAWREGRVYRPQDVYAIDPLVRLSLDALASSRYAPTPGAFDWVKDELFDPQRPLARARRPRRLRSPPGRGARRVRRSAGLHREGDPDARPGAALLDRQAGARRMSRHRLRLLACLIALGLCAPRWSRPRASVRLRRASARSGSSRRRRNRRRCSRTPTWRRRSSRADETPPDADKAEPEPKPKPGAVDPLESERQERKLLEAEWRVRFANAREQVSLAEADCWHEVVRTEYYQGIPVQMKVKEFVESEELRQAKQALSHLEEEFRRTGNPPGWAREP